MIDKFDGKYRFLSNFYNGWVVYDGDIYHTVEQAYQAAKTLSLKEREKIQLAKTAAEAKKLGKKVTMRPDWDNIKLSVMEGLVKDKFVNSPILKDWLLDTGDEELVEGNWWGDTFWGVCKGVGENHLGKILMKVRDSLK